MKKNFPFIFGLLFLMISSPVFSQSIDGAWELKDADKHIVLLFKDGYFTHTEYTPKEFVSSWGGISKIDGKQIKILIEFNSADSGNVGKEIIYDFIISNKQLQITDNGSQKNYKRIDNGVALLAGVWKISARKQDGKIVPIHQTGSRKTLKMLTGNRFQWFAINPETKQFSGTGGGTYSFINGKYTENILFFSRDNSRVGAHLTFDGKLEDGKWHHSGLSSKGDKIYEVWSRVTR
ncbi:MAG TPA: hypothetical protein VGW31_09395 [Hanamia sp.]|nr:hypothetical protein [Hanamia sp.]